MENNTMSEIDSLLEGLCEVSSSMRENASIINERILLIADYREPEMGNDILNKMEEPRTLVQKLRIIREGLKDTNIILMESRETLIKAIG
jgi:hypothetical protein